MISTEQRYRDKLSEIDGEYNRLLAAIKDNRDERTVWQHALDSIDKSPDGFPVHGKRGLQILYILNNIFGRAVTMTDLEDKHRELLGKNQRLANVMRRLKREGHICSIRYNKQNTKTFWGLREWVWGDDFKNEFKPLDASCLYKY